LYICEDWNDFGGREFEKYKEFKKSSQLVQFSLSEDWIRVRSKP
jgi:hypothetical protein